MMSVCTLILASEEAQMSTFFQGNMPLDHPLTSSPPPLFLSLAKIRTPFIPSVKKLFLWIYSKTLIWHYLAAVAYVKDCMVCTIFLWTENKTFHSMRKNKNTKFGLWKGYIRPIHCICTFNYRVPTYSEFSYRPASANNVEPVFHWIVWPDWSVALHL